MSVARRWPTIARQAARENDVQCNRNPGEGRARQPAAGYRAGRAAGEPAIVRGVIPVGLSPVRHADGRQLWFAVAVSDGNNRILAGVKNESSADAAPAQALRLVDGRIAGAGGFNAGPGRSGCHLGFPDPGGLPNPVLAGCGFGLLHGLLDLFQIIRLRDLPPGLIRQASVPNRPKFGGRYT